MTETGNNKKSRIKIFYSYLWSFRIPTFLNLKSYYITKPQTFILLCSCMPDMLLYINMYTYQQRLIVTVSLLHPTPPCVCVTMATVACLRAVWNPCPIRSPTLNSPWAGTQFPPVGTRWDFTFVYLLNLFFCSLFFSPLVMGELLVLLLSVHTSVYKSLLHTSFVLKAKL